MATLSVWKFETAQGADAAAVALGELSKQGLITVDDSATVSWEAGKKKPKTRQGLNTAGVGALGGSFWGLLFGLIFFVPFLGAAIGAGIGALTGALTDVGIDDEFIGSVRDQVVPGTSALFLMSENAVVDKVRDNLQARGIQGTLIQSNLSNEQEAQLREAFSEEA
ncbi:DUF1269 domain-containing protein [Occultella aeris]|uniref:DUF1269 domain-containing protein n=1 Tax=Occultella aeris TaxID=2761496 RepID=A0A7M4DQK2_9MICO|nr:DUF1269 domain-containing protein [Occultella aeris]VZO39746.1 hypothetical protein HALOF300_04442 [Occultella aeris]